MNEKLGSAFACGTTGCFAFISSMFGGDVFSTIERVGIATVFCVLLGYVSYKLFCRNTHLQDQRVLDLLTRIAEKDETISHIRGELDAEKLQKTELLEILKEAKKAARGLPPSVAEQINNVTIKE